MEFKSILGHGYFDRSFQKEKESASGLIEFDDLLSLREFLDCRAA